jgi:hypothetical protein
LKEEKIAFKRFERNKKKKISKEHVAAGRYAKWRHHQSSKSLPTLFCSFETRKLFGVSLLLLGLLLGLSH